jgi:DNA-directed RNA polymerase
MSYVNTRVPGTSLATPPQPLSALGGLVPDLPWWAWLAGGYFAWRWYDKNYALRLTPTERQQMHQTYGKSR